MQSEWLQLELICDIQQIESLGALLIEEGALGTEERSELPSSSVFFPTPQTHKTLQLRAYFPSDWDQQQQAYIASIALRFDVEQHTMIWSRIRDDGWSTKWQTFFQPLPIGTQILICPTWEQPPQDSKRMTIWLDPGMAFGTGHHATTRGCIQMLEELVPQHPSPILDIGCGSGILSMAAIRLGATSAYGIDIDADAVQIAIENAELNHMEEQCTYTTEAIEEVNSTYPLIVANIQAHILQPLAPEIVKRLQPKGILLLSGIWHLFADDVLQTYAQLGYTCTQQIEDEGWCTMRMEGQ